MSHQSSATRRLAGLAGAFILITTILVTEDPVPVRADQASSVTAMANGVESLAGMLENLPSVGSMATAVPFTGQSPASAGLLDVAGLLANLKSKLGSFAGTTVSDLSTFLNDPDGNNDPSNDGTVNGATVDLVATVSGSGPYTIALTLNLVRDNASTPFVLPGPDANGDGLPDSTVSGTFDVDLNATLTFAVAYDETLIASQAFRVLSGGGSLTYAAAATLAASPVRIGVLAATASGSATTTGTINVLLKDPDLTGGVTSDELSSTAASDLFDAAVTGFTANGTIPITASVGGLGAVNATVTLGGTSPTNVTATFSLGALADFENASPLDIINSVAQIASSIGAIQTSGLADVPLPFTGKSLADVLDLSAGLKKFLIDNGITSAADPLSPGSNPNFLTNLANYDTVGEVASLLATAIGAASVPVNYDPVTKHLTFSLTSTSTAAISLTPDLSNEVASIGIASVAAGASTATLTAGTSLDLTFGIDLGAASNTPLAERLFFDATTTGPEFSVDLPIAANLDLNAAIGFVALELTDSNATGTVPLVGKRAGDTAPMLSFDLGDGPVDDGILTLKELFDALSANQFATLGTLAVNAAVPLTTITATAKTGATTLASGTFTIAWPDITAGSPTVTANADFQQNLLDFGFNASNSLELFTQMLDAVQAVVDSFNSAIASSTALNTTLPVVGTSFQQIADKFDAIRASLDTVIGDPENTLQTFETQLENVLGDALAIPAGNRSSLLTFSLDTSGPNTVLLASLDLGVCSAPGAGCSVVVPVTKTINLGLGSSGLVGVSGAGDVALTYAATISLDVGVELPQVTPGVPPTVSGLPVPFVLDSSQVSLSLGASTAATFSAYIGPLLASVGVAADPAALKVGANFLVANPGFGGVDHRVPLDQVGTFLSGALPTDIAPTPAVSCDGGATSGSACAKLPIYVGATKLGDITFLAPDLLNPAGWTFTGVDTVLGAVTAQAWDWTTLLSGVKAVLDQIKVATDGKSFGAKVPILGDALDAGANVANAFNDSVVTPLDSIVSTFNNQTDAAALATLIDNTLTTAVSGAGLLIDRGGDGDITNDVQVFLSCDGGGGTLVPCGAGAGIADIRDVQLQLSIGKTSSTNLVFNLGLPGLSLAVKDDPAVNGDELVASVQWRIDLAFGISRADGFYLRTDNPISGSATPEISLSPGIDLPNTMFGSLAFIPVKLTDNNGDAPGSDLSLTLGANITTAVGNKLSLGQLLAGLDPGVGIVVSIDGNLDLKLGFTTGLSPTDVANFGTNAPQLPVFSGTFEMGWSFGAGFGTGDIGAFANSTDFTVGLKNVTIDLGSFIGKFLSPITKELDRFARPLKPVLDTLNSPIPGIKELAELFSQTPPTMLDLIDLQNGPDSTQLIRRLIILVDFITATNDAGGQPTIMLGDLDINPAAAKQGALSGSEAEKLIKSVTSKLPAGIAKPLDAVIGNFKSKLTQATDTGGFTFPAFDNPASLIGMLIGKDVDLVRFDAGQLEAKFSKTFKFGPPIGPLPISVGATVSFKVTGHLEIGYDTRGIRDAIRRLTNDDPNDDGAFGTVATLLQGVFLDDNKNGVDVPEISLVGTVSVQAAVDILIAEAGIRGGVNANLDLNLHDGGPVGQPPVKEDLDGKLRINEIIKVLAGNPLCLFDTSGKLTVFLELYESNIFSGEDTWPLASATLADFDNLFVSLCTKVPVLAHVDTGVLVLHVGRFKNLRDFDTGNINETMTVRQTGAHKVSVSGFGYQQDYDGVNSVFADAQDGNDNLAMQAGGNPVVQPNGAVTSAAQPFTLPVVMCGGPGDDVLVGGDAIDRLYGDGQSVGTQLNCDGGGSGNGNDHLNGGGGDDNLSGQGGNDVIGGDGGNDHIFGDSGFDTLNGGAGDDPEIFGGNDPDQIVGGDGNDTMHGDNSDDTITGGPGQDTAYGDNGADRIDGGDGGDTLNGGADPDTIFGGTGVDTIHGDAGDDDLFGDAGGDTIFGDDGGDDIIGGADNDTINGGVGRDYVLGDDGSINRPSGQSDGTASPGNAVSGADTINGNDGADVLNGERGADTMNGGNDSDLMYGGDDSDTMNGDAGTDVMFGESGTDTMHGNADNDYMRGGDDADSMFGDDGDDEMYGDSGADTMSGGNGMDTMRGNTGADRMTGDANADTMHGDASADCMAGNGDADTMFGDAGDDRMAGGSFTAGQPDGADTMDGGDGNDIVAGDNADVCDGKLILHDQPFLNAAAPNPAWSGDDSILGSGGNDILYGQGRNETLISGGDGDDYIEGNGGNDTLDGGTGADDMIGGSGHDLGGAGGAKRTFPNTADGSDTLLGQAGSDHMAGDNADLVRTPTRTLELFDVAFVGATVNPASGAADVLKGGDDPDIAYGQAGNDLVEGEGGDDYLEGNSGVDTVNGGTGQDDMVGGSGRDDGPHTPPATFRRLANVLDEGDIMDGGADQDVMLGDNGSITRPGTTGLYGTIDRAIELYDVEKIGGPAVSPDVSGDENPMVGGSGNDTMFGQGGNDRILAGDDEDYAEGNSGADTMYGGAGQDDLIGGGSANDGIIDADRVGDGLLDGNDLIAGDATSDGDRADEGTALGNGADVTMGDNARVIKLSVGGAWKINEGTLDIERSIVQFDVENANVAPAPVTVHGDDLLYGNANDDVMRGQGGADTMYGGAGDDDMEGNPDADLMYGQSGQDDMIGGSRVANRRDSGDQMYGGPDADFQLGDNGDLVREVTGHGQYRKYVEANPTTIVRTTTRFDVGGNPASFGGDSMFGESGDDSQWGQDGNDTMRGGTENDDMFGELGADRMYGEAGQDAMLGDRGGLVDRLINGSPGDPAPFTISVTAPPAVAYTGFRSGTLDRRVDMRSDPNSQGTGFSASLLVKPGTTDGGDDFMLGGPGHDSLHGGAGNDIMNGESGGDILFGDDGADVMWGGKGCDPALDGAAACPRLDFRGAQDQFVDYLFGGYGGPPRSGNETAADILDYRPRPGVDPAIWFEATSTGTGVPVADHQHHQGIDWIYGGWDRDVLQADTAGNGPNDGDRLIDWPGAYNLFTHCNSAYGGFNDVRELSPAMISFLEQLAYGLGAGPTLTDVRTAAKSGFVDLAMVYTQDIKDNNGKAFSTTPGHFENFSCAP
jgi:Ca2+-binding RTX toxin-like protein